MKTGYIICAIISGLAGYCIGGTVVANTIPSAGDISGQVDEAITNNQTIQNINSNADYSKSYASDAAEYAKDAAQAVGVVYTPIKYKY